MISHQRTTQSVPGRVPRPGEPGWQPRRRPFSPARGLRLLAILAALLLLGRAPRSHPAQAASNYPFSLAWASYKTDTTLSVAWGDYNNDGLLDLAVANQDQPTRLYRNDGYVDGTLQMTLVWSSSAANNATSLAWGDYNNDGWLDLAVGNSGEVNRLYRNDAGTLTTSAVWSSTYNDNTQSLAWGDYNGDGYLDLAVGNWDESNYIYRNNNGVLDPTPSWSSNVQDYTSSVAWADYNGDGKLDLAVGNRSGPNRLYRNDFSLGGNSILTLVWTSSESEDTTSLAWGDFDHDGHPDLAVGNYNQLNRIYRNSGSTLTSAWVSTEADATWSVAWGDFEGDGDLDLAAGNSGVPNRVYRNDGGALTTSAAWSSTDILNTKSVAWGDYDNDGSLDLALANSDQPVRVYRNETSTLSRSATWSSGYTDATRSVAWGDVDNDGDLDLAVGSSNQSYRLYRNDNGTLVAVSPPSQETYNTTGVAWGDVNGDGYLDLAVSNSGYYNQLYLNDHGSLSTNAVWSSNEDDDSTSLAWGDYDGDGDLDLAVGNWDGPVRLYRNDNGVLNPVAAWSSTETDQTRSVAWGDYDGDGDLDLAVGNDGQPNRLYRNDNGVLTASAVWSSSDVNDTYSLAWGDYDGDGDLDLAAGNRQHPDLLYRNDNGMLTTNPAWTAQEASYTYSLIWGDVDGDGDLDLVTGNQDMPLQVFRNDNGVLSRSATWFSNTRDQTTSVALGDVNGDGKLDLITGNDGQPIRLYLNQGAGSGLPGTIPVLSVSRPGANADLYSVPQTWSSPVIPITYTLTDINSTPVAHLNAWYSTDGGGHWLKAEPVAGTVPDTLESSPTGAQHIFQWDVFASGFFGNSDDVVIRLQAVPGVVNRVNAIPGPYLRGASAASTFPFRVRGSQVRVFQEAVAPGNQAPGALVYRLPAGLGGPAEPIADLSGKPMRTDNQGYLQGKGELGLSDQLVALLPITATQRYTLYATSAAPTPSGLDMFTVNASGVQTLTVSTGNSLILLNLKVSLEWDARQDTRFLEELDYGFQRASELLYDWTNGQVAIGEVTLYQDRQNWDDVDVRIYASNHRRPAAVLGGITEADITDPVTATLVYQPGMVHIGLVWNRYGDPGSSIGEDWPRALAHELGHYALFLDDDYLGLDANGHLILVNSCTGTAMTDPYRDDYSEFKTSADWLPGCADVLANLTTGRADWDTITAFYPTLSASDQNPGPSALPLAVTRITQVDPPDPPQALADPRFYLKDEGGASLLPGREARAYLLRGDETDPDARLVDLGRPTVDSILAPGVQPGDQVCVIELSAQRAGCKEVSPSDDQQLTVPLNPDWQPEVQVSPVTSVTVSVAVANLGPGMDLRARLYPGGSPASEAITLIASPEGYQGVFHLAEPTVDGYVRIWEPSLANSHEVVVDFAMGGNPARMRSGFARMRSGFAPATSTDGQVILYSPSLDFPQGEFYTFQAATFIPNPPPWATVLGQAYWLTQSAGAPSLSGSSLDMGYVESDVAPGEEAWIKIYRWNAASGEWEALPTTVDTDQNTAFAVVPGPGLYVLMTTIEIPLYGPGWDQFAYPVQTERPVTEALQSIAGKYNIVYWYDGSDPEDYWKVFAPQVPEWVNDLTDLQFGEGYWIHLTQSITLKLKGTGFLPDTTAQQLPPATYYGTILAMDDNDFKPEPGKPVYAWIDNGKGGNVLCGQGVTQAQKIDDRQVIVYTLNVSADGPASPGCGKPGSRVIFQIGDYPLEQIMATPVTWDNTQVWNQALSTRTVLYIPILFR